MPITKMEHFLVMTHDIETTRDFYQDILGFHTGFRADLGFAGYWLYLDEVPVIHIAEWDSYTRHSEAQGIPVTTPAHSTGVLDHIAFNGTHVEEMIARLEARGIAYHRNDVPVASLVQLFLNDPNGLKIELNYR